MPVLFGRQVFVELGTESSGTGRRLEGLRIGFEVDCNDGSEPNNAKVEVYGVGRDTVAMMQEDDALIRLYAGYTSTTGARLLFEGNPTDGGVKLDKRGADRVLVVEAQDGGNVYRTSFIAESYAVPTTSGQLFDRLALAFGLPLGSTSGVDRDIDFPHGIALTGPVRQQMDRVAAMSGARWQIRDGALHIWPAGGTTGESATVFSAAAGNLIGSPKPTDDGIEVTALLAPTLRPGKPFRVESEDYTGDYVATSVRFRGDSGWARDFYVIAKGTAL